MKTRQQVTGRNSQSIKYIAQYVNFQIFKDIILLYIKLWTYFSLCFSHFSILQKSRLPYTVRQTISWLINPFFVVLSPYQQTTAECSGWPFGLQQSISSTKTTNQTDHDKNQKKRFSKPVCGLHGFTGYPDIHNCQTGIICAGGNRRRLPAGRKIPCKPHFSPGAQCPFRLSVAA